MRSALRISCLIFLFVLVGSTPSYSQVTTGTPAFGSFSASTGDVVNNANLNVHITVPVINKPGRGLSFASNLSYDSSVWYPVGAPGSQSWQFVTNWGWRGQTEAFIGYVTYKVTQVSCRDPETGERYYQLNYSNWAYHDEFGVAHSYAFSVSDQECGISIPYSASATATDGSGYYLYATANPDASVRPREGGLIYPPLQSVAGSGTKSDTNGNTISANASSPQTFTDTLGTAALSISGAAPNPVSYSYKNAAGTSVSVTIYYVAYTVKTNFGASGISEYGPTSVSLIDHIILPNNKQYSFTYEPTPSIPVGGACTPLPNTYQGNCVTARIASQTLPTGGQITYGYSGGSNGILGDGTTATLTRTTPDGQWTFARSIGSGAASTTTMTDPLGNRTVMQFQWIYETQRQAYEGTSTLLQTVNTCYNGSASPCTGTAITPPISRRTVILLPDSGSLKSKNDSFFNTYGLPTEIDEYDFDSSNPPLVRKTLITYASLGNGIVGRPATVTVCSATGTSSSCGGTGTQVAQTTFTYDETSVTATSGVPQHNAVSGSRGNPTTIKQWISGTTYATSTMTYYDTGTVKVATDPGVHNTTFSYTDSWGDSNCAPPANTQAFPTQITNHLSQNTQIRYFQCTGQPYSVRDPNDIANNRDGARFTYNDSLSRLRQVDFGDGGQTTIAYDDTQRTITTTQKRIDTASISETDLFDQLSRLIQRQLPGSRKVDVTYDFLGRVSTQSNPYVTTNDTTYGLVTTVYDALSRVKQVTRQDGSSNVSVAYSNNEVKVTNEMGKKRLALVDGLGRTTKVCEVTASSGHSSNEPCGFSGFTESGYITANTYNVLDNVTQIVQGTATPQQQTRTMAYDGLGRITSALVLEVSTSTAVTYGYDADSNRTSVTDPRGTVNLEYDVLHRLIRKKHGTTVKAEYTYDGTSTNNAIGRLITEWDGVTGSADKSDYTYDPLGRIWTANRTVSSTVYAMSYDYDYLGNILHVSYPSSSGTRRKVEYAFNSNGEATSVQNIIDNGQTSVYNYVSNVLYANLGPMSQMEFGSETNPVRTTIGWTKRALIDSILTQKTGGGATFLNLGYLYYADGKIQQVKFDNDVNNLKTETYTYDDLQRLLIAQRGPDSNIQRKYTYDYDRFGNRWAQTVTGGSGLGGSNTFDYSNNRVTSSNFSYDASGNLTANGSGSSYTYNQENFLTAAGSSAEYKVDAEGRQVKKCLPNCTSPTTTTDYFYAGTDLLSEKNASSWKDYIFFAGQRIAEQTGSTAASATYLHTDHLGSTRVCTDANGASAGTCDYEPFGEIQSGSSCSVPTKFRFAGMQWDADAGPNGLYHTWFRQYDPNQGRWMGVDPLPGTSESPQSLNRYAHVVNDPVNLVDPYGLQCSNGTGWSLVDVVHWNMTYVPNLGPDDISTWVETSSTDFFWMETTTSQHCGESLGVDRNGGSGGQVHSSGPNPPPPTPADSAPCPVSSSSIDDYLKKTPMAGQGSNFMATGQKYNLDPRLLVSLAGAESSFGRNITAGQFNALNVMYNGYNSPFSSFQSNINSAGKSLTNPANGYDLTNTSTMYNTYCSGSKCAAGLTNLNTFMGQQKASTSALHYPCK